MAGRKRNAGWNLRPGRPGPPTATHQHGGVTGALFPWRDPGRVVRAGPGGLREKTRGLDL